jgi:hypothetical protein
MGHRIEPPRIRVSPFGSYVLGYYWNFTLLWGIAVGLSGLVPQIHGTSPRLAAIGVIVGVFLSAGGAAVVWGLGTSQIVFSPWTGVMSLRNRFGLKQSLPCADITGIGIGTVRHRGGELNLGSVSEVFTGDAAQEVETSFGKWPKWLWPADMHHVLFADVRGKGRVVLAQAWRSSHLGPIAQWLEFLQAGLPPVGRVALYRSWGVADAVRIVALFASTGLVVGGLALALSSTKPPNALWTWGPPIAVLALPFLWLSFRQAWHGDVAMLPGPDATLRERQGAAETQP